MLLDWVPLILFACVCLLLLLGYPVAFTLGGTALIFAGIGIVTGYFDPKCLSNMPARLFGLINNETLLAVPLFVFMGVVLEKTRIAETNNFMSGTTNRYRYELKVDEKAKKESKLG